MVGSTSRGLHRFAVGLSLCVVGLIAAGGLVKSLEAGLSVPDWPTSYGGLNPPRWWEIENVRAEHGHRLIAGTVATLTVLLAVWAGRREPRQWVRRIAYAAVAAVLLQALLGGLTVLFFLPTAISVSHAALAQLYLCLVVTFAAVTSRQWLMKAAKPPLDGDLRPAATATTALIYLQVLIGALVRHTGSGLAIPDFPRMFGGWWPDRLDPSIGIHLAHRLGAVAVTVAVVFLGVRVLRSRSGLGGIAVAMLVLLAVQVTLGAFIIWTGRAVLPNTWHVPVGASLLGTSWLLTLGVWRGSTLAAPTEAARSERAAAAA